MTSNEERISRLEGIAEATAKQLGNLRSAMSEIRGEMSELRAEMRAMRQEIFAEIRSTRNMLLMVMLVMWMTTIGTILGLFFGAR